MDYCGSCLVGMFQSATNDTIRMPPRCCNLIQIHTALNFGEDSLTSREVTAYQEKFEEWISPTKVYCPYPRCSAFIPERKQPSIDSNTNPNSEVPSLKSILSEILEELTKSLPARFFRGDMDLKQFPDYHKIVHNHMDLTIIRNRLLSSHYKTSSDLTKDVRLIMKNATVYNGEKHPVAKAAKQLFDGYLEESFKATDRLVKLCADLPIVETLFACPKCHIAICVSCKQIEHTGQPCDTSARDHELAMLETYGYKRCPRCKVGVKKMFGCSHMQCVCGAHWCYYCLRSIELCDGACEARFYEEEEEDYDSEEDGSEMSEAGEVREPTPRATEPSAVAGAEAARSSLTGPTNGPAVRLNSTPAYIDGITLPRPNDSSQMSRRRRLNMALLEGELEHANRTAHTDQNENTPSNVAYPQSLQLRGDGHWYVVGRENVHDAALAAESNNAPANLDGGGPRRWEDGDYNFGEEPDDTGVAQVWSCYHEFERYNAPPADGVNRGDLSQMECNRCFVRVRPKKEETKPPSSKKRRKVNAQSQGSKNDPILIKDGSPAPTAEPKTAWECVRCKLVVCVGCKDRYKLDH